MSTSDELLARLDSDPSWLSGDAAARIRTQAAQIAELETLLRDAGELFEDSQSWYIPGCEFDQKWTARRNALMASIEALRADKEE